MIQNSFNMSINLLEKLSTSSIILIEMAKVTPDGEHDTDFPTTENTTRTWRLQCPSLKAILAITLRHATSFHSIRITKIIKNFDSLIYQEKSHH